LNGRSWPDSRGSPCSPKAASGNARLLTRTAAYGLRRELTLSANCSHTAKPPTAVCEAFDANGSLRASSRTHTIGQLQPYGKAADSSHPLTGPCQEAIAFFRNPLSVASKSKHNPAATRLPADSNRTRFLAPLAANRIAPVTHQVQACRDVLRLPWRRLPPQRNVGAKPCPRGWSHWCGCRDGDASPLMAHGLGDSVICYSVGWHKDGVQSFAVVVHQTASWLTAFGQTITQNSAAHRRASAHAACGSTPAPVCARSP
jgi:hypothetical protein